MKNSFRKIVPALASCIFCCVSAALCFAQASGGDGPREPSFGRGGLDLGWGNPNFDDDDEEAKEKATPTPTPKLKEKDDTFFQHNVEDTGAADKL